MLDINKVYKDNCLGESGMCLIKDKSIDLILCDLPYEVTSRNKWDKRLPFEQLWPQYERIIKDNGVMVFTARQPFTTDLIMSNRKLFKYTMVWRKNLKSGNLNAKKRPMVGFEDIVVFYKKQPTYNPQRIPRVGVKPGNKHNTSQTTNYGEQNSEYVQVITDDLCMPDDVLEIKCVHNSSGKLHPTQKPVELMEWFIKTFSNEGDLVLDNCAGSGSTLVGAKKLNRNYIGFEIDKEYYEISNQRLLNT